MSNLAALILAAGCSSRLGQPKQLLRVADQSLVRRIALVALASGFEKVVVVTGSSSNAVSQELAGLEVQIVENIHWAAGMGSSINAGMSALHHKEQQYDGVGVLLTDQPAVNVELMDLMIRKFNQGESVVACNYADTVGVPALFGQRYFKELSNQPTDKGAKFLLKKYCGEVATIAFPEGQYDIDTQADLEYLNRFSKID